VSATQNALILAHMKRAPITPLQALDLYGCFRLGARIWDLKQQGYAIGSKIIERNGKRFCEYSLKENGPVVEAQRGRLDARLSH